MSRDLNNFVPFFICHNKHYAAALRELHSGKWKTVGWIAFIFPRLVSPQRKKMESYFELKSVAEAQSYLDNPVLAARLFEASSVALAWIQSDKVSIVEFMGSEDEARRLLSSMTLFEHASIGRECHKLFQQLKFLCQEQLGGVDEQLDQCSTEDPVLQPKAEL